MKEQKAVEEPKPGKETPIDAIWTPEEPTLPEDEPVEPIESVQPDEAAETPEAEPTGAPAAEEVPAQAKPLPEEEDFPWYGEEDNWLSEDMEKTCFTPQSGSFFQERQHATPAEVLSGEREPERKWIPAGPAVDFEPENGNAPRSTRLR